MKIKLLKKAKKNLRLYERNGFYYVDTKYHISDGMTKKKALEYYRFWVIRIAKDIFGFKPKNRIN